jgi:hypothetical protein
MAIVTKDELINKIKTMIGDDTSDDALSLLEDASDTLSDLEGKTVTTDDWRKKYEENDKAWRQKYKERFSQPVKQQGSEDDGTGTDDNDDVSETEEKPLTFENLFKEGV